MSVLTAKQKQVLTKAVEQGFINMENLSDELTKEFDTAGKGHGRDWVDGQQFMNDMSLSQGGSVKATDFARGMGITVIEN